MKTPSFETTRWSAGSLLYAIDFSTPMRPDLTFRTVVPADRETVEKFNLLEGIEEEPLKSDRGRAALPFS